MSARHDLLGKSSVTTLPGVIVPIERLQRPLWPAFVIALALLLTLLWSGTVVWFIYRILLSALF
jgi:alpha-D-ribose 1-methylphosphonate 5-triphosphate synthase subunit PhnH